jgi:hypothetical protein
MDRYSFPVRLSHSLLHPVLTGAHQSQFLRRAEIGGFGFVAAPAEYKVTGVRTFIVSHDGAVYEKDLGAKTLDEFKKMERLTPMHPGRRSRRKRTSL